MKTLAELQKMAPAKRVVDAAKTLTPFPAATDPLPEIAACPCGGGCPSCGAEGQVQAKLRVSQPGDACEQEADRNADRIVQDPFLPGAASLPNSGQNQVNGSALGGSEAGQPLPEPVREFYESRLGHEFSTVRIHTHHRAAEQAREYQARAFTLGDNIFFDQGEFLAGPSGGQRLLAHELTHVVQQRQSGKQIQRWPASYHQVITHGILQDDFPGEFSPGAGVQAAFYSGQMDQRGCNYLQYIQDFVLPELPVIGRLQKEKFRLTSFPILGPAAGRAPHLTEFSLFKSYTLSEYESPNHGEANMYQASNTDPDGEGRRTYLNEKRAKEHLQEALTLASEDGITKQVLIKLGQALHVGQDRGSHEEGIFGRGHSRKFTNDGKPWKTDDPDCNTAGVQVARKNTRSLLKQFLEALVEPRRKQLRTIQLGDLSGDMKPVFGALPAREQVRLDPSLPQQESRFKYVGLKKDFFTDRYGLPYRGLGMFPLFYDLGFGYFGADRQAMFMDAQVGARVLQISPRIYVDVSAGTAFGVGMTDSKRLLDLTYSVQLGYTGKKDDIGLILKSMPGIIGTDRFLFIMLGGTW